MVDQLEVGFHGASQVTFHDLHVVNVVLQEQVVAAYFGLDFEGLLSSVQIEARDISGVDHFHDQANPSRFELAGGEPEVLDKGLAHGGEAHSLRMYASQAVDLGVAQNLCVLNGLVDASTEFVYSVGMACDAALALGPIASGEVEQHLSETVGIELLFNLGDTEVIGEEILDSSETSIRCGFKTS
ncbi:hypothetical protein D3C86_1693870 [compost metagenome]